MWFLCYLWLMNSLVSQFGFQNVYRFSIGITQVGIIEISLAAGLLFIMLTGAGRLRKYPSLTGMHPVLKLLLATMFFANFMAAVLAIVNSVSAGYVLRLAREYLSIPVCLLIGYFCMPNPRSAWRFIYIFVLGGCLASIMTINSFNQGAEKVQWGGSWNLVRTVSFVPSMAGLASMVCFFSLVDRRVRFLPTPITIGVGGFCILGQFAPMHRGDWVATTFAYLMGILLLPRENRIQTIVRALVVIPIVSAVLFAGVQLGSRLTQRNYGEQVIKKIVSLLPTERKGKEAKAWDSRVGSVGQELEIWSKNPLIGNGFAIQNELLAKGNMADTSAYFHNGWASVLAQMGLPGLIWVVLMVFAPMVIGYRIVKDAVDRGSIWIGFASFCASGMLLINVLATMIWTARSALCFALLFGVMFRVRDMQATTLAMREASETQDETWLYEHGHYNSEGGWLAPGQL